MMYVILELYVLMMYVCDQSHTILELYVLMMCIYDPRVVCNDVYDPSVVRTYVLMMCMILE